MRFPVQNEKTATEELQTGPHDQVGVTTLAGEGFHSLIPPSTTVTLATRLPSILTARFYAVLQGPLAEDGIAEMSPPRQKNTSIWYPVWEIRNSLAIQDPDATGTRYHTAIFVETNEDKSGILYHVIGDITSGMSYQMRSEDEPEAKPEFYDKELLGHTSASAIPVAWDSLLSAIPPPGKQKAFNTKTMKTEMVKSWEPLAFYEPGEVRRPPFKCTEWADQKAIPALKDAGLLICGSIDQIST